LHEVRKEKEKKEDPDVFRKRERDWDSSSLFTSRVLALTIT